MYRPKSTLEQWRILQAVVDYGGYAQAAKALNKSQSSLNHAVAKLQSMLGVQLLSVIGRKAELTEAGVVMLRRSRDLSQNIESLEQLAVNINQDWEPEIILSVDLAFPRALLLPALDEFLPQSRGSRLTIIDTVLTGSTEAITQQQADLAIVMNIPKGYLGEALCHVEFLLVCHPDHELAQLPQPLSPSTLAQHLQIVIKDTANNPQESTGWLKSEKRWTVSQFDTAIDILKRNIGFCWLPKHKVFHNIERNELRNIQVQGSAFKQLTGFLVSSAPEQQGPGTALLSDLILQHRQIALP